MYPRPKPSETEEDLLRLQAEFDRDTSRNEIKPAATVVSGAKQDTTSEDTHILDIQEQIANTFEAIPASENLGKIMEKSSPSQSFLPVLNFNKSRGFPVAKRRDTATDGVPGGSIFAQQFKKIKPSPPTETPINLPSQSFVLSGREKEAIHVENLQRLRGMTEAEILEERQRLLATTDPAIIAFLRSRRATEEASSSTRNLTIQEQNLAAEEVDVETMEGTAEVLHQAHTDKWLHFGEVEANKLAWMRDVDRPKIPKNHTFEARFDFEGWLLPYREEEVSEKSRILYHHGEEAGRPGYTLQELFQLARSNVMQQKTVALNSIANILSLYSTGVYDDVIDLPLEQIFFVLRFCLDDNTPSVLNAAIKAMRNLFHSQVDEVCLDSLLGFGVGQIQPVLAVDNDTEDDNTVNDQQLAESNLVKCLARTDILVRIRYIINTVRPSVETVAYCMDILTRLVRDSQFILTRVYNCPNLIESIMKNFVPITTNPPTDIGSPYGLPLLQAVKLLRLMTCRSRKIATDLVGKYRVMDALTAYITSQQYSLNTNGLKLQTECLHMWSVFMHYGLASDYLRSLHPVLMELVDYHYSHTNLDATTFVRAGHAAAIMILLSNSCQNVAPFLQKCAFKWLKQFSCLSDLACGKLQLVASLFHIGGIPGMNTLVLNMIQSQGFDAITKTIKNGSMLLNNYQCHTAGANLMSVEAAAWFAPEHVIPLLQTNSPLPFLSALSDFVMKFGDREIKLAFLRHPNIIAYLECLRRSERYSLCGNWFTRVESALVMNVLKMAISVREDLDTCLFYEVAVKSLNIFTSDQKKDIEHLLGSIIFSPSFYPSEVLMGNLRIDQKSDCLETSLDNLSEILEVYTQVLGLKMGMPSFGTSLSLDYNLGSVIPVDWIYTPIIVLYSDQQKGKDVQESAQVYTIRNCLRWILIYETYFPNLAAAINPTDRFCRIACVFLGSDNLFLIDEIHNLLKLCLDNVLKCETEINFNRDIQGLSNFQDFYTQLLEQYQGVSYGDVLFGNFVLVPLAQRHAIKWRKVLWSEYLGVVEIFNVTAEQSVCPLQSFLEPKEEDLSLLKCYRRALVNGSVRKHSVLYSIAKHHVDRFIERKKNKG